MSIMQNVLNEADNETAELIVQLQLEDVASLVLTADNAVAHRLYERELRNYRGVRRDRNLAQVLQDQETALAGGQPAAPDVVAAVLQEEEQVEAAPVVIDLHECAACTNVKVAAQVIQAPCSHYYCDHCVENLFHESTRDETLYPPRCCKQDIPFADIKEHLTGKLQSAFQAKKEELDTKDRTYCFISKCSTFIGAEHIKGDTATCPACEAVTCTKCKGNCDGSNCPNDESMKQLQEMADAEGWRRCRVCHRMVELKHGCNHITCLCKAHFCYICGGPWKPRTCACPQWDEGRIIARAERIQARDGVPNAQRVAAAVQVLRNRHDCTHDSWARVEGRNQCEECRFLGFEYMNECQQCRLMACNKCMHNRL